MDIRQEIIKNLEPIIFGLTREKIVPLVTPSQSSQYGDFTTNIALQIAKDLQSNSRDVAEEIKQKFIESEFAKEYIADVEVAGPGFINFYLSKKYFTHFLNLLNTTEGSIRSGHKSEKKTIVEFGDPNPFKEIHIGHLRNFAIGETYARLLESQNNEVVRANYQGDVGMHVAKAIYGIKNHESRIMNESLDLDEKTKLLAQSYAYGAKKYEEDDDAKKDIQEINKKIYRKDPDLKELWEKGRSISLDSFEELYKRLHIHYDKYYFESVTAEKGREIVLANIENGVFEQDGGAVIYRGEKEGLHTRVFLTREDYATYEAKDLALAVLKSEDTDYDRSVILTGNEQTEYFQVMLAALEKIRPELADKTDHYTFGHVRLKDGKMSSRTGDVITASWLLDEAVSRVHTTFPDMDGKTAEKVGVGAVRYSMLKYGINSDIHFSFDESISLEGNSGPYLQYSYVRTQSVLSRMKNQELEIKDENIDLNKEEGELLRFLVQFPVIVEQATEEFAPNLVCNYLFELAQKFNAFYQKHKIIGSDSEEFRIELTRATGIILQNGLTLLGIETVDKM